MGVETGVELKPLPDTKLPPDCRRGLHRLAQFVRIHDLNSIGFYLPFRSGSQNREADDGFRPRSQNSVLCFLCQQRNKKGVAKVIVSVNIKKICFSYLKTIWIQFQTVIIKLLLFQNKHVTYFSWNWKFWLKIKFVICSENLKIM